MMTLWGRNMSENWVNKYYLRYNLTRSLICRRLILLESVVLAFYSPLLSIAKLSPRNSRLPPACLELSRYALMPLLWDIYPLVPCIPRPQASIRSGGPSLEAPKRSNSNFWILLIFPFQKTKESLESTSGERERGRKELCDASRLGGIRCLVGNKRTNKIFSV
jgi:hypothetical protein